MYRMIKTLPGIGTACALVLTFGCDRAPQAPTPVDATTAQIGEAAADGSTLKVNAPTALSPTQDVRLENRRPVMVLANTSGRFVSAPFSYEFQLMDDAGRVLRTATLSEGNGQTVWAFPDDLELDTPYRWQARATYDGAFGPWSAPARFLTLAEKRTPNPPPGARLPRPDWAIGIVQGAFSQRPDLVRRSCQSHGGSWEFMDYVVDLLRQEDTRFGYNCKRGNCADPSHDVIAYNRGIERDEGTRDVYIIDIILGHCGDNPQPAWQDVTQITIDSGSLGRWTSRGRF